MKNYFLICFHYFDILAVDLGEQGCEKMRKTPNENLSPPRGARPVRRAGTRAAQHTQKPACTWTAGTGVPSLLSSVTGDPSRPPVSHTRLLQPRSSSRLSAGVVQPGGKCEKWQKILLQTIYHQHRNPKGKEEKGKAWSHRCSSPLTKSQYNLPQNPVPVICGLLILDF